MTFYGLNTDMDDFDRLLSKDELVAEPVDIETFVMDKKFLGFNYQLSDVQLEIARHMTQILKPETLVQLHGEEKGLKWYNDYSAREIVCKIGKGGGKDHTSRVSFAYIAYLMHCLRDPWEYYGMAHGVKIAMLNIAVNAEQAQNVFFNPLKELFQASPYFRDVAPHDPKKKEIEFFNRPLICYSGHSDAEGWEGYDLLVVVLDEISAFKTDSELKTEGARAKNSASGIYEMAINSVASRFPNYGKVVLLSFPRFRGDFIEQRYAAYEKDKIPGTWGIKATTWECNPTKTEEMYAMDFIRNPVESRMRFMCEPPEMTDAFFRDEDVVRNSFIQEDDPVREDGTFAPWFNGTDNFARFIHIDLAQKHDHAALAMAHCIGMRNIEISPGNFETLPIIKLDYIKYWEALPNEEIPFDEIRNLVFQFNRKFTLAMVSFDEWQSVDMAQSLRAKGISVEKLTIRKPQYDTLSTCFYDRRFKGYGYGTSEAIDFLVDEELLKLKLINNTKVDHGANGWKDGADALAGAVWHCITYLDQEVEIDIEIWNDASESTKIYEQLEDQITAGRQKADKKSGQKKKPKRDIPEDLSEWLMEVL